LSKPLSIYQSVHMVRLAGQCFSRAASGEIALWQERKGSRLDKHHQTSDSTTGRPSSCFICLGS